MEYHGGCQRLRTSGGVTITADHKATVVGRITLKARRIRTVELTSKLPHVTLASASTIDASNVASLHAFREMHGKWTSQ